MDFTWPIGQLTFGWWVGRALATKSITNRERGVSLIIIPFPGQRQLARNLVCWGEGEEGFYLVAQLIAPQSGAHSRGAFRDFQSHAIHPVALIVFEHSSLYLQNHLSQSVTVCGSLGYSVAVC